jgi:hypothetical protein
MSKLALLHATCVFGRFNDATVCAVAAPGVLDHVQVRPAQPERVVPIEARTAWQFSYASAAERDEAAARLGELRGDGLWHMVEDRPQPRD